MTRTPIIVLAAALCAPALFAEAQDVAAPTAPAKPLQPFRATYAVEYRGIGAGDLMFTLRRMDGANRYEYFSKPRPSLLAKIIVSGNALETSVFEIVDGRVRPLKYRLDDGRSATEDDVSLDFDWAAGRVTGVEEDERLELELSPGIQDRMSIQIQVMMALQAGGEPGTLPMIDGDRLKEYTYTREGTERVPTSLGTFETVVYSSTRPGSNRVARFWYAPELGFAPVRGEQERKGKVETVMKLTQFGRID